MAADLGRDIRAWSADRRFAAPLEWPAASGIVNASPAR